jgi:hypothetical protein
VGKSAENRSLEDIGVNERKTVCEDRDWIKLAQGRDTLRTVVSRLMNFCVPHSEGVGWQGKELLGSQAVLPSATEGHPAAQHSTAQHSNSTAQHSRAEQQHGNSTAQHTPVCLTVRSDISKHG